MNSSREDPVPTSTVGKDLDVFDKELVRWRCVTVDSLEFLSDGTVLATSTLGGGVGTYTIIDSNRLKIDSPRGSVLWIFSVRDYVDEFTGTVNPGEAILKIEGEAGCVATQWARYK